MGVTATNFSNSSTAERLSEMLSSNNDVRKTLGICGNTVRGNSLLRSRWNFSKSSYCLTTWYKQYSKPVALNKSSVRMNKILLCSTPTTKNSANRLNVYILNLDALIKCPVHCAIDIVPRQMLNISYLTHLTNVCFPALNEDCHSEFSTKFVYKTLETISDLEFVLS